MSVWVRGGTLRPYLQGLAAGPPAPASHLVPFVQVPKRSYSLQELRLNKIQAEQFLAPKDTTLNGVSLVEVRRVSGGAGGYWRWCGWGLL